MLLSIPDGPFASICCILDAADLCRLDASSRQLRALVGRLEIWKHYGIQRFSHMTLCDAPFQEPTLHMNELARVVEKRRLMWCTPTLSRWKSVAKESFAGLRGRRPIPSPQAHRDRTRHTTIDWKSRCRYFVMNECAFREPFVGSRVTYLSVPDEVAYLKANLVNGAGVYCEVDVKLNADNLSLSVVDFDVGGKSSVTFSPDTGTVIKETKVQESPRIVKGFFTQSLPQTTSRFHGRIGLYIKDGMLAFFRKGPLEADPWLTTNFCTSSDVLMNGSQEAFSITPCLAFRDQGKYDVSVVKVCRTPPIAPVKVAMRWKEVNWAGSAVAAQETGV